MSSPSRRDFTGFVASSFVAAESAAADSDIHWLTAVEMAKLIRARKLSAREALAAHLKQIERVNPKVNAIVTLVPELAAKAAAEADERQARKAVLGPLHGLPVAHKDLVETKGIRTTFGSPLYKDYIPAADELIVERLRAAGAITVGKTNTPEFGAGSQTFNAVFGATRNPYDVTKTCGGSSGGAAVALACGMVPVADGSDLGGSLRNPAAFCNVTGFRPSLGRVPNPRAALPWSSMSTHGCLGRSAADLALGLSAIAGPDARSPLSLTEPGSIFSRPLDRDFRGVRAAWFKSLGGAPFDARIRTVIDGHRKTFESLGCVVEEAEPDFSPAETCFRVFRALGSAHAQAARLKASPEALKATIREEAERGLRLTALEIAEAEAARTTLWRTFQAFMSKYEYFILPTTQVPPFSLDVEFPAEVAGVPMRNYIDWMKSCWYISATGNPAASVPAGFTPEGLPVGLQIVGRHHADFAALQLAHAFEQATGVGRKRPSIAESNA